MNTVERWEIEKERRPVENQLHHHLKTWDRKLYRLDQEMLWYVFKKAGDLIDKRTEEEL